MARYKRKDSLVWGLILLIIGFLFLLHNIDVNVADSIARLWPLILIVWGVWKLYFGIKERREELEPPRE
jgi:hypothetical protein